MKTIKFTKVKREENVFGTFEENQRIEVERIVHEDGGKVVKSEKIMCRVDDFHRSRNTILCRSIRTVVDLSPYRVVEKSVETGYKKGYKGTQKIRITRRIEAWASSRTEREERVLYVYPWKEQFDEKIGNNGKNRGDTGGVQGAQGGD